MERLKELLLEKERLFNDTSISDNTYYLLVEDIDNEIANNYSFEEIAKAEKEVENE